ncbi:MAG: hypothetical protein HQM08_21535 [Candidatus Riflebacteria bacterium]|nr:hypothetical protein [Candidatus Riflebacteria bacterium]
MKKYCVFLVILFALCSNFKVAALVSLDPNHQQVIELTDKSGNKENYTFLRDFDNPFMWYYVPNHPRLAEVKPADATYTKPIFQMMTFQTDDGKDIGGGAILQFSLQMDIEQQMASDAAKVIADRMVTNPIMTAIGSATIASPTPTVKITANQIKITPLQVSSATINLYKPDKTWCGEGPQMPGIAPSFATQQMPFQLTLTELGADAYKCLCTQGTGGIGCLYSCYYEGVTPASSFTITVDWDQTFKHLSSATKTVTEWSCLFWGGSSKEEKEKVEESLLMDKSLIIDSTIKAGDTMTEKYLDNILNRINNELLEAASPPTAIEPAKAEDPGCGFMGMFGGSKSTLHVKDIKKVKHGKEVVKFNKKEIVSRCTSAGSFIGIGHYPQFVRDQCVFRMKKGHWEKAYFVLPPVGDNDNLNILSVNLNCCIANKAKEVVSEKKSANWAKPKEGNAFWYDPKKPKEEINSLPFAIATYFDECEKNHLKIAEEYQYKVEVTITFKDNSVLKVNQYSPLANGDFPTNEAMDVAQPLVFDVSALSFGDTKTAGNLNNVGITVNLQYMNAQDKLVKKSPSVTLDSKTQKAIFVVEKNTERPITANVTFKGPGLNYKWANNGKNLWQVDDTLNFTFYDLDWKPNP